MNSQPNKVTQLNYNNQIVNLCDPEQYRPLDDSVFYWYPPDIHKGVHRSEHPSNQNKSDFNLHLSSRRSYVQYANQIKHSIMGLDLTDEQRRNIFWKALSLPGLSDMVQSFGLTTRSNNMCSIIAMNMQNFLQYSRTTHKLTGRGTDAHKAAENAVITSCLKTPPRATPCNQQNNSGVLEEEEGTQQNRSGVRDKKSHVTVGSPIGVSPHLEEVQIISYSYQTWIGIYF